MTPVLSASPMLLAAADVHASTNHTRLVIAALIGIAAIVLLITQLKLHPFLSLAVGSGVLAVAAGIPFTDAFTSFGTGLGSTVGSVGVLIALGAVIGKLLVDSGGADEIVDAVIARTSANRLPWAMALATFVIGIPLFFEVGVVLVVPIVMLVAQRSRQSLIRIGMPALAGLSVLHGLVPPHPGPLIAINALHANLGITLGLGLIVAIPTVIISGPLLAGPLSRWVDLPLGDDNVIEDVREPALVGARPAAGEPRTPRGLPTGGAGTPAADAPRRPSVGIALATILLPVVLMLAGAIAASALHKGTWIYKTFDFVGTPLVALLITALVGLVTLGTNVGRDRTQLSKLVDSSFAPIASILLIVGAGGGFKQTLVDSGVAQVIADAAKHSSLSALLVGWLIAVGIRLATGSATVATVTASGIVAPLATNLSSTHAALLALAVGAGSLFLSHVNDAGFWLVKEYFGLTVGQTLKSWSVMETAISVVGVAFVLLLDVFV